MAVLLRQPLDVGEHAIVDRVHQEIGPEAPVHVRRHVERVPGAAFQARV